MQTKEMLYNLRQLRIGAWDSSKNNLEGDMVTEDGKIYVAIMDVPAGGVAPAPGSLEWNLSEADEQGGTAWKTGVWYKVGDIVSHIYSAPEAKIYICLEDHDAPSNTSPDTTNGEPGNPSTDSWEALEDAQERGGIAWKSNYTYYTGDVVSYVNELYVSAKDVNSGNNPASDPSNWRLSSKGGGFWRNNITYIEGDIVSYNYHGMFEMEIYTCLKTNIASQPNFNSNPNWKLAGVPERGGVEWESSVTYSKGDVVSYLEKVYVSIVNGEFSKIPSSQPGYWKLSDSPELGGLSWDQYKTYPAGTFVTHEVTIGSFTVNKEYVSRIETTNDEPSTNPLSWKEYTAVKWLDQDTTFTVGATGDFSELSDCLLALARYTVVDKAVITIELQTGYVLRSTIDTGYTIFPVGLRLISTDDTFNIDMNGTDTVAFIKMHSPVSMIIEIGTVNVSGTFVFNNANSGAIFSGSGIYFKNCTINLKNITFGAGTTSNGYVVFSHCKGIAYSVVNIIAGSDASNIVYLTNGVTNITDLKVVGEGTSTYSASAVIDGHSAGSIGVYNLDVLSCTGFKTYVQAQRSTQLYVQNSNLTPGSGVNYSLRTISGAIISSRLNTIGSTTPAINTLDSAGIIFHS